MTSFVRQLKSEKFERKKREVNKYERLRKKTLFTTKYLSYTSHFHAIAYVYLIFSPMNACDPDERDSSDSSRDTPLGETT